MSITCLKEAQTIQNEFFAHAMEILEGMYDENNCIPTIAHFSYGMKEYSPRQDLDSSIWKYWVEKCCVFVYALSIGKGTYPYMGFSFAELYTILDEERGSGYLELNGDDLVSDPIECSQCYQCACGQCSPCSCF